MHDLLAKVKTLTIQPSVMTNGAGGLIEEASQSKITGEEERYSHDRPRTRCRPTSTAPRRSSCWPRRRWSAGAQQLITDLTAQFADVQTRARQVHSRPTGSRTTTRSPSADVDTLKTGMAQLSEVLSQISGSLGLEVQEQTGS